MASPIPKPTDQRRNRNPKRQGDWIELPQEGFQGPIPELPKGIGVTKPTQEWWETIWRSPMATQWSEADIPALVELAMLRERLVVDGKVSVAAEVRLRSDEFGLTPAGRQQRRWIITEEDAARAGFITTDELKAKRAERKDRLKEAVGEE